MTVWMTARGAGLAALVLLTVATAVGALVSGRGGRPTARVIVQYVHRAAAGLGLGVLLLHVATVIADTYAKVGVTGALVPFTAGYRATWVGLGTLAAYALVVISVLGAARGRMATSARAAAAWRAVHVLAYPAWALAMVHGFTSGTDSHVGWVRLVYLVCGGAVAAAFTARLAETRRPDLVRRPDRRPDRRPALQGAPR